MSFCQFEGPPCLRHNNYIFYKSFKYKRDACSHTLTLGEFFFLKILQQMPVCIGEIELLWEDRAKSHFLASIKLYFQPEDTPDGRQDFMGEDEVIALGDRVILTLDDLIALIQHNVHWTYGCLADCPNQPKYGSMLDGVHKDTNNWAINGKESDGDACRNGTLPKDEPYQKQGFSCSTAETGATMRLGTSGLAKAIVLSYPKYCRYRAIRKRLEGWENQWLHQAAVMAIGGYSGWEPGCRVMFCRETFDHPEWEDFSIGMSHYSLPELKTQTKTKKSRQISRKDSQQDSDSMDEMFAGVTPSVSISTRPRRLTESSEISEEKVSTEEQAFLIGLHKYMHDAKMPIGRIPSLGFKQIDLYFFYKQAEKLGGYDSITHKRMWKHLYDKLGGNSSNTSAATCTRKHYERLLLPYERHLHRLKIGRVKKKHQKHRDKKAEVKTEVEVSPQEIVQEDVSGKAESQSHVEVIEDMEMSPQVISSGSSLKQQQNELIDCEMERTISTIESDSNTDQPEEHSRPGLEEDSQVMELPLGRHCAITTRVAPAVAATDANGSNHGQESNVELDQQQQQQQQLVQSCTESLQPSQDNGALEVGESQALPYTNVLYREGYLLPVLPPQMLQSPWNVMIQPSPSSQKSHIDEVIIHSGFRDAVKAALPPKISHSVPAKDEHLKTATKKLSLSSQNHQLSAASDSDVEKVSHIFSEHIEPAGKLLHMSHISRRRPPANSSPSLAALLHPGHNTLSHLPPAPSTVYLHPSSVSLLSSLSSAPVAPSSPPAAHNQPRKRVYSFDSPTAAASAAIFPSPDMVLDRIRNSTALPRSTLISFPRMPQRFEDPRQIFAQSPLSIAVTHNVSQSQKKVPHVQPNLVSSKLSNTKSKNSRKSYQAYTTYNRMPSAELQQTFIQQGHGEHRPSGHSSKTMKATKTTSHFNGMMSSQLTSKSVNNVKPTSAVPSASPDGRLTSALFGTQFTALPRTSKPSELTTVQTLMSDPSQTVQSLMSDPSHTVQSLMSDPSKTVQTLISDPSQTVQTLLFNPPQTSVNSHLHPAFISPYLPAGSTSGSSQLQMLTNTFPTQAQLAAYEEMFRHNGYGAFLAAAATQEKLSKKN